MRDQLGFDVFFSIEPRRERGNPRAGKPHGNAPGLTLMSPRSRRRYFGDYEFREEMTRSPAEAWAWFIARRQVSLDRAVALEMILPHRLDEDAFERFRQEAESAGNLDHPNIVPVYEIGQHDGQHFLSMKLIEGRSLKENCPDSGKTPAPRPACWRRLPAPCTMPISAACCIAT